MSAQELKARQLWVALLMTAAAVCSFVAMAFVFEPLSVIGAIVMSGVAIYQWVVFLIYGERIEKSNLEWNSRVRAKNV